MVTLLPDWLTDIQIETATTPFVLEGATVRGVLWQATPGRFLLDVPDVARYCVEAGRTITIEPAPKSNAKALARFLRMTPLSALLYQRGMLAFHAAGAANANGAVLFAGDSGAGKSTLLAALLKQGWMLLADDLAVVDLDEHGPPLVRPTFAEIRLWPDTIKYLDFSQDLPALLATAAKPLRAIYWLTVHNQDDIELDELTGAERFRALGTLAYNSHIADALLDRVEYMRQASIVARSVPIRRLRRPRGRWSVVELADQVVVREF